MSYTTALVVFFYSFCAPLSSHAASLVPLTRVILIFPVLVLVLLDLLAIVRPGHEVECLHKTSRSINPTPTVCQKFSNDKLVPTPILKTDFEAITDQTDQCLHPFHLDTCP